LLEYCEEDSLEPEVRETPWYTLPSNSQIVLVTTESTQPIYMLQVSAEQTIDHFRVSHKSIKTYFRYEKKKFTVALDNIDSLGGQLDGQALVWPQSSYECGKMSHHQDTFVQYKEIIGESFLGAKEVNSELK
jgi:hypothetical protein